MAYNDEVSCAPLPQGGYDYEFVDSPPDTWECPVCLSTLRDPHLLSCCGVKICQSCIEGVCTPTCGHFHSYCESYCNHFDFRFKRLIVLVRNVVVRVS